MQFKKYSSKISLLLSLISSKKYSPHEIQGHAFDTLLLVTFVV